MDESEESKVPQSDSTHELQAGQMGKWAPYYDLLMTLLSLGREKKLRGWTLELSKVKAGDRVLEIGCGTGTLTLAARELVGPSGEASGIDLAPEMVAVARRKAAKRRADVTFQEGSIASIPFPEDRFDVVLCSFMIFHMPEDVRRKGIVEISRVLAPGGHLCILDGESTEELLPLLKGASLDVVESRQTRMGWMKMWFLRARSGRHA